VIQGHQKLKGLDLKSKMYIESSPCRLNQVVENPNYKFAFQDILYAHQSKII
jgi:hypothetical protein